MKTTFKGLNNFCLLLFVCISLSTCNPGPGPDPGVGNNQQIFEVWQLNEVIRKSCTDANNNFRRTCVECHTLVMNTDNTFFIENEDKQLINQGNFRVVNETEIIFDPGIFTGQGVSTVNYNLFKGGLRFDYNDTNIDCAVTEAYLVKSNNVAGD